MPVPKSENHINKLSTKERIYQTVCEWIVKGTLEPGEKISDTELAQHFGVSRTPVREALLMLELQKLVSVHPGKATIVTDVDTNDIEKCYYPLSEVQALAIRNVCVGCTDENIQQLRDICNRYRDACISGIMDNVMTIDAEFHDCIMEQADNEYMKDFSKMLVLHVNRARYRYFNFAEFRNVSMEEHEQILDAIIKRDEEIAAKRLREHWLQAKERLLEEIAANR